MKTTTRIFIAITAFVLLMAFIAPIIMYKFSKPKPEWKELTEWEAISLNATPFNGIAINRTDSIYQIGTPVKINISHSGSINEAHININEGWSEWANVTVNADTLRIDIKVDIDNKNLKFIDYMRCEMIVNIELPADYMHSIINYSNNINTTACFSNFNTDYLHANNIYELNFDNCNIRKLNNITTNSNTISSENGTVLAAVTTQLNSSFDSIILSDDCSSIDSLTVIPTSTHNELNLSKVRLRNLTVQPVDTCSNVDIKFGYNTLPGNLTTTK